ncbi:MAG: aldehyde dehydrogenase [Bacteroidia bacterium]
MSTLTAEPEVKTTSAMKTIVSKQREFFNTGVTKSESFRREQLTKLKNAIIKYEKELLAALKSDLNKSEMEAFATEIGISIADIDYNLKRLGKWMKPERVSTPLFFLPGSSWLYKEPYGVSLIIGPWNYPFKNTVGPLIGAISAGNTIIIKPSELSSATSAVINKLVTETFDPRYMKVIEGGAAETTELIKERFDYILFTGGTEIGRIIYQAAAKHLTPVTLELGGKSPCIVDADTDLDVTVKRIAWGKFVNAGQTCIAPDYVLINKKIKPAFIEKMKQTITEFYGADPKASPDFPRIISDRHFERVKKLIEGEVVAGGQTDASQKYISPTVIDNVTPDHKVMQEEIFGPIVPLMEYDTLDQAIDFINQREKPLALYIFSNNKEFRERIINETSSGAVLTNDVMLHAGHPGLPFGGVGNSGTGAYNGKFGFDTFSHTKPVLKRPFMFDVKQKYAPYTTGNVNFIKFAIRKLL